MSARNDLTSRIFGRLTVASFSSTTWDWKSKWECHCSCGNVVIVLSSDLLRGRTKSCGCLRKETLAIARSKKTPQSGVVHGHARNGDKTPTYNSWVAMWSRCTNPNTTDWKYWGGRGITVCNQWKVFDNFLLDMGLKPKGKRISLDRFPDQNGNYQPGNCRWATPREQSANRRPRSSQTQSALKAPEIASTPL